MIVIQMTGMSGAGKSSIAESTKDMLVQEGYRVEILDGDEYRLNLCSDLGFSKEDRNQNIRRLGFVAKVLARNGTIAIIAAINPYEQLRREVADSWGNVKTVYVKCPIPVLKDRDTKNLYHRASLPDNHPEKINNLTGISDPFEKPPEPDLVLNTDIETVKDSANRLKKFIKNNISS
tara:strand:+ start:998 stop:1528 length:531 start_codon:yes stop_codon:yes gene_type:complete